MENSRLLDDTLILFNRHFLLLCNNKKLLNEIGYPLVLAG